MKTIINKIFNEDMRIGLSRIPDESIDLVVADPPYGLGKDYGNASDKLEMEEYLQWSKVWSDAIIPKIKLTGIFYVFLTWL